jgi:hypothetical protein
MRRVLKTQRGSALIYILIAIALLAALTATFMDSSSQQTSSQNAFNVVSELNSQINFIRSAIQECVLTYPGGDTTMPADPVGGEYPVRPYPLMPTNLYLASPAAISFVSEIRCPGNPGNSNNHAKIFAGTSGKFLPPPPKLFAQWGYYNGVDGVFLFNGTNHTDAYLDSALQKLDAQFSKCELQYINNTSGGSPISIISTPGWECLVGTKCIVVRIVTTGTTIYPGEVGCP